MCWPDSLLMDASDNGFRMAGSTEKMIGRWSVEHGHAEGGGYATALDSDFGNANARRPGASVRAICSRGGSRLVNHRLSEKCRIVAVSRFQWVGYRMVVRPICLAKASD